MKNITSYKDKKLLSFIYSFLHDEVDYEKFISYIKFGLNLKCSVQLNNSNEQINFLKRDSFKHKEDYITFALGHISTNPQNTELSYLLKNLYIYNSNESFKNVRESINHKDNVSYFYKDIQESCESIRQSIANNDTITPHIFYIEGNRGAGKTIFINHFFTKYNDDLAIKDRILWVRVDLDLNFSETDIDILNYIGAKLLKIILKHYCRHSKYNMGFFIGELKDAIKNTPDVPDDFKENLLNGFYRLVTKFHNNQPLEGTYEDVNTSLIDIMYKVLNDNGFKTVFILDNIDLLDKSNNRIKKFSYYLDQIKMKVIPSLRRNGVLIITYRSNIHNYIVRTITASGSRSLTPYFRRLNIVEYEEIFFKKENLLLDRISAIGNEKSRSWDLSDWPEQLYEFRDFIISTTESHSIDDFFHFLDVSFGNNNRSKTQMIQLLYQAFILSRKNKTSYKLIEYLFLAGNRFPPKVFHYKYKLDSLILEKVEKVYDNIFVPNLFTYPYHPEIRNFLLPYSKSYLLTKFRIIQLLLCFSLNDLESIKVGEITSTLTKCFNYDERIILLCIDEFFELEFIKIEDEDNISSVTNETQILISQRFFAFFRELSGSKVNEYSINFFNLFNDIAYLNLCAARIDVAWDEVKENCIFFSTPYDTILLSKKETLMWIKKKLINSVILLKYISEIEKFENKLINQNMPEEINRVIEDFPKLFEYFWHNIERQIKSSITNLDSAEKEFIETEIKTYIINIFDS